MKRKLGSFLAALVMLLTVSAPAFAADAGVTVDVTGALLGRQVVVQVAVTAENVTNGKLRVTYDATKAELASYTVGDDSWVVSVNTETPGVIGFAWIDSDLPASAEVMLTLWFNVTDEDASSLVFRAKVEEAFASGEAQNITQGSDSNTVQLLQGGDNGSVQPPIVVDPQPKPDPEPDSKPDPEVECPFTDIKDHWAEKYIIKAYSKNLIKGVTATTYEPNSPLNRGAFITLLYRLSGSPEVTGESPFTDVATGLWYSDAVIWAYNEGIVKGANGGMFYPLSTITRQEMAVMLYRYAEQTGRDVNVHANLNDFEDVDQIASWATDAMEWAVGEGILIGNGRTLTPREPSYRSQIAVVLVRYADL